MSEQRKKTIAVIGAGQPSAEEAKLAEEVGRELAKHGAILVCGGLGGVMEAACKGASSEGGITIGELFSNKDSYANKTVLIKGQVTKVNRAIMGKNWVHLQDGTSGSGNYDLTITTQDEVSPGDVVTFEGKIALNKDFGAGYAYDVLMEDAKRQAE